MSEHSIIDICVEPIELYKLLKIADIVGVGQAKTMISEGNIIVNSEVETQKRKKIRQGDIIEYNGKSFKVAYNPNQKSAEFISTVVSANKNAKKKKRAKSKAADLSSKTPAQGSASHSKRK